LPKETANDGVLPPDCINNVEWMVQIIKRNQLIGLEVLQKTYEHLGVVSKRNLLIIKKFNERLANVEDLIIDITEQSVCRPGNDSYQKDDYSGGCCSTPKKSHG
jgi:hypothetical protein